MGCIENRLLGLKFRLTYILSRSVKEDAVAVTTHLHLKQILIYHTYHEVYSRYDHIPVTVNHTAVHSYIIPPVLMRDRFGVTVLVILFHGAIVMDISEFI